MNFYILSHRSLCSSVGYDTIYELEDLLAKILPAEILYPNIRSISRKIYNSGIPLQNLTDKIVRRTIGQHQPINLSLPTENRPNILLLIGLSGADLQNLSAIPDWRKKFDVVVAYIFDSWILESYDKAIYEIDHLFVPMPEVVDLLHKTFKIPVSSLPFGVDALTHGSGNSDQRSIDVVSYGRIPAQYNRAFFNAFNYDESKFYYRSTVRKEELLPLQPYEDRVDRYDRLLLFKILRRSKIALNFDTMYPGMRTFPYPFLTLRWFECGASGCVLAGKRPTTPLADQLLNWEDAAIELPDDPLASVKIVEELLHDHARLKAICQRNYLNNLMTNDWRWRIASMFEQLQLPLPNALKLELEKLQTQISQVENDYISQRDAP